MGNFIEQLEHGLVRAAALGIQGHEGVGDENGVEMAGFDDGGVYLEAQLEVEDSGAGG